MPARATKFRNLQRKVQRGDLIRIQRGIYALPEELASVEGDFYRATLICGKRSAICLLSALQYYGLVEQIFKGTWILLSFAAPRPKNSLVKALRSRRPRWNIGIESTPRYRITNVERSIVDAFRYRRMIGVTTAIYALQTALREKQTTKTKIYEMAKKLGAEKSILPYLEAS